MNRMKNPLHISLIIFLIWLLVIERVEFDPFVNVHHMSLAQYTGSRIDLLELASLIFVVLAVIYLKWLPQVGLKGIQTGQIEDLLALKYWNLRLLWLPTLVLLFILLFLHKGLPPNSTLEIIIINTLMVGIFEELMFRGILFYGVSSSFGVWRAVWITAIIFGSIHMLSGFLTGDFVSSTFQAFNALVFGFWIATLRIQLGTIIPGIIIHWVWDCLIFMLVPQTLVPFKPSGLLIMLPFNLLFFYYGLKLLKKNQLNETKLQISVPLQK